ncbi:2-hydroxyacyl-CoA lyase 2 isoform X1 [Cuculus canorus]|nr:2-hydroxyacyl-CoA lyase 2 isoform X1 [Cuculus canorus]XP_053907907.1 2-hydroxyacyl-CoA lyase 2 isoform X1 [Cuculus canorus]XP_053907908.1 2-hydroxyacyl-CoA lyase 2 isoform X1 [Cuculus canorus]XP_053907909.1 2-hydroxyacyl-CoA lyase 2 isoform X1 [Cuculus canorus]XP_053907911.1 2-hydroxyacyl-CoA lyase 2 isoform X1 [Cuculus canorus]
MPMDLLGGLGCACAGLLAAAAAAALVALGHRLGLLHQLWYKVDPRSPRHGGELVAEVLKAHGVRFLFTLTGGHISPILVASEKIGIRVVDTRHEATAVFAADAVSRLSGRIGVAAVTAGPGVTNTVTAIKNAQMAESPVLLLGGAAASLQKGRGALQDIDQLSLFKTLCKACVSVRTVRDIVPTLRKAIATAQSATPGPVFVELPIDVLYPFHVVEKEIGGTKSARGLRGKVVQWYLQNYVRNLFAGAWDPRDVSPLPVQVPLATEEEVQRCAELVSRATKPLVLVGSQAMLPPTPAEELRAALEALGIPCYLGGAARGLLPPSCPFLLRHNRRDALRDADLVLLAGTVCDFRLSYGRLFGRRAAIVAVNRDRAQLLRNSDVFWKPRLAVQGDAASFVVRLAQSLRGYGCSRDWVEALREAEEKKEQVNREKAATPTTHHLNPLDLLYHLDALLPAQSLLVADGGDFVGTAAYIVRPRRPLAWLDPGAFGTLGVGGGFALGAKLCRPDAEVWVLYGDGSLGYSLMEFDTFVRHKSHLHLHPRPHHHPHGVPGTWWPRALSLQTPVIALVGNDACWSQIAREQVALLGSNVACGLEYLDYHAVAEALGGKGFVVGRGERERLDAVLRAAQDACRHGRPVLINALIGKTDFRDGSISV